MSTTEVDRYSPFPPLQTGPRKRDSPPSRARPKSRYEYVKAHRFSTQAPLLSILPIQYSLTEGTSIPAPTMLDTPPQTPEREEPEPGYTMDITSPEPNPNFSPLAGPLSSHPISHDDILVEDTFASIFTRPTSMYSTVATFGRPSSTYERDSFQGLLTPPPSGGRHAHRPSVLSRIFSRRSTRSDSTSSTPSTPNSPFHRSTQSSGMFTPISNHYHPNGGVCAFCDPMSTSSAASSSATFPPRGMKRINSTYSFQASLKRNTTIYAGEVLSPIPSDTAASFSETSSARKSGTFPRLMRQKSIDMLRRKSGSWFRDLEAEEEEEAARMRAAVAAKEKERESEMRLLRELAERREEFEVVDEEDEEDGDDETLIGVEPPPVLPELSTLSELGVEEEDPAAMFEGIGKDDDEITIR